MIQKALIVFLILGTSSCRHKKTIETSIACTIDDDVISINAVDITIQNQLYEGLFEMYYLREIALEEILKERLLNIEAKNKNLTRLQLINKEVDNNLAEEGFQKFIKNNSLSEGVLDPNNPLRTIDSNSEYGKKYIAHLFREWMLENYITSLKKKYKVVIHLSAPLPPKKNISDVEKHFKEDVETTIRIVIISAFDCPQCINFHPTYQKLYEKYKDKVQFGQAHFGPEVNLPMMVSEYAHRQGKFWEMYDLIYEQQPKDTAAYFQLAKQIRLDSVLLVNYLNNTVVKQNIQTNLEALMAEDIIRTPSILINDRLYYGGFSFEKISEYLDDELSKVE